MMWLEGAIVFTLTVYAFESYLDYRQYRNLCDEKPPSILIEAIEDVELKKKIAAKFQDSQAYGRAKARFGAFKRFVDEVLEAVLLLVYFGPWVWELTEDIAKDYFASSDVLVRSLLWIGIQHYLFLPLSIPFQYYQQFVIEEQFGFNKMTLRLFLTDFLKTELLTIVIGAPLMVLTLKVIEWGGEYFYLYVRLCSALFTHPFTHSFTPTYTGLLHDFHIHDNHDLHFSNIYTTSLQRSRAVRGG